MSDTVYAYICEGCGVAVPHGFCHDCARTAYGTGGNLSEGLWQVPVPDPTNARIKELEEKLAESQADADRLAEALVRLRQMLGISSHLADRDCLDVVDAVLASRPEAARERVEAVSEVVSCIDRLEIRQWHFDSGLVGYMQIDMCMELISKLNRLRSIYNLEKP